MEKYGKEEKTKEHKVGVWYRKTKINVVKFLTGEIFSVLSTVALIVWTTIVIVLWFNKSSYISFIDDVAVVLFLAIVNLWQFSRRHAKELFDKKTLATLDHAQTIVEASCEAMKLSQLEYKDSSIDVRPATKSLLSALKGWNYVLEKAGSDCAKASWLKVMETYFREESYDIFRQEIVTNARNFPFLLLGITQSLIDYAKVHHPGKKVHYVAFTSVEPKHWADWPRGNSRPRAYYEEWFIATFSRALSLFIKEHESNLIHHRFILCTDGNRDANRIGEMESKINILDDLKNWCILPCSVPLHITKFFPGKGAEDLTSDENDFYKDNEIPAIVKDGFSYYQQLCCQHIDRARLRNVDVDELKYFIPMFNNNPIYWDKINEDLKKIQANAGILYRNDLQELSTKWKKWNNALNRDNYEDVYTWTYQFHKEMLGRSKRKIENILKAKSNPEKYISKINELYSELEKDLYYVNKIVPILQEHDASIVAFTGNMTESIDLWKLFAHSLRMRDSLIALEDKKALLLGEWFIKRHHSKDEKEEWNAYLLPLSENMIDFWKKTGLGNEFALWGIEENGNKVDWKIMFTSELSDPFRTTRLQLAQNYQKNDLKNPMTWAAGIVNKLLNYEVEPDFETSVIAGSGEYSVFNHIKAEKMVP